MQPLDSGELDEIDAAVADARREFVAGFERQCEQMTTLIDTAATGSAPAASELGHVLHRIAGLAGTIGFPTVTTRAREFEDHVRDTPARAFDAETGRQMLVALRAAFRADLSR